MTLWTLNNLIEQVQGVLLSNEAGLGGLTFHSVTTDSRQCQPGSLYIAIKGTRFNGHEFIQQAFERGAVAAVVSQFNTQSVADKMMKNPLILVEDTRLALGQFAAWHRQQIPLKSLIALTGSNGKTTTKALLKTILETQGNTLATRGNLNNDFGVPRTLLELTQSDEYAVIEMGANHSGEIEYLTQLARPNIALINNASSAHLEGFGDLNGVIYAKAEILNGLSDEGIAILNQDTPGFDVWQRLCQQKKLKYLTFGEAETADVRVQAFSLQSNAIRFELCLKASQGVYPVELSILGKHNAFNAAAAVAVCLAAGLKIEQILPGLGNFIGVKGRLKTYAFGMGVLIDDAYNANPASMQAGIETLVALPDGEPVLVLGGMAELGAVSVLEHEKIAMLIRELGVKQVYLYGELTLPMLAYLVEGAKWFETHDELIESLLQCVQDNNHIPYHILVKGSRSSGMEVVVQALLKEE